MCSVSKVCLMLQHKMYKHVLMVVCKKKKKEKKENFLFCGDRTLALLELGLRLLSLWCVNTAGLWQCLECCEL